MKTQDLKNSILQLAVQGKLVPQDPSDEPANELLARIRKERAELIEQKKIKKPKGGESVIYRKGGSWYERRGKSEPACIDDEIPFDIPESWEWARLGFFVDMQAGKNIAASNIVETMDEDHPYPCYGGNGLRGFVGISNRCGRFPIIGRQGALCGCINYADGEFYATEHAVVVTCFANVNVDWCGEMLKALNLNQYATATAQPGLAVSKISEILSPVPPIAEQRRIVARVDELMPLVEEYGRLEEAREKLDAGFPDRLRKSVLQLAVEGKLVPQDPSDEPASELLGRIRKERAELIEQRKIRRPKGGESVIYRKGGSWYERRGKSEPVCIDDEIPFDIPESWEWTRLGSFVDMQAGKNISATKISDVKSKSNPYPCYGGNGLRGYVSTFNREGNYPIIGRQGALCGCINYAHDMFYATEHAVTVKCFDAIDFLWCGETLRAMNLNQYATATAQPGLAVSKIAALLMAIPPLEEQKRIVERVDQIMKLIGA